MVKKKACFSVLSLLMKRNLLFTAGHGRRIKRQIERERHLEVLPHMVETRAWELNRCAAIIQMMRDHCLDGRWI